MKNSFLSKKKTVFVVSPIGGLPRPWESSTTTRPSQSLTSAQHSLASATIRPNLPLVTIFSEPSPSLATATIVLGSSSSPLVTIRRHLIRVYDLPPSSTITCHCLWRPFAVTGHCRLKRLSIFTHVCHVTLIWSAMWICKKIIVKDLNPKIVNI
jgi:hypothetical protein